MKRSRLIAGITGLVIMAAGVGLLGYEGASYIRDRKARERELEAALREPDIRQEEKTELPRETEKAPEAVLDADKEEEQSEAPVQEEKEPYVSKIDFEALWDINTDIYAYIEIDGTDISYPVLQSVTNDGYYLNHTPEGKSGRPASIFTLKANSRDFTDFNTVIYGHNMKNGLMFGKLKEYRDEEYLDSHRTIRIYLPDRELVYKVFAAVVYDDRLITSYYKNDDPEACARYLDSIYGNRDINSHVLKDTEVTEEDRIITLSTCVRGQRDARYLIVAVLTDEIT